jgi:putative ABC transport system permease protein
MRSGLHGFRIFLACIVLGVGAIAMIGSLSAALERGIDNEGQALLGGDIEFSVVHRELTRPSLRFSRPRHGEHGGDRCGPWRTAARRPAGRGQGGRRSLSALRRSLDLDGGIALPKRWRPWRAGSASSSSR